jgi:hypothetical protein
MTEITPPSRLEYLRCDPNRTGELLFITFTEHSSDSLQLLESRYNCERAQVRVISKPLYVVIMIVDEVPDGSCDIGAGVEKILNS